MPAGSRDAVRAGYDALAEAYADRFGTELSQKPLDRALLRMLAHEVGGGDTVGDVGCGPGHVAAHLQSLGVRAVGVDLSPSMIAVAARRFAGPVYLSASMLALPLRDATWAGAVALYSIVHLPDDDIRRAFAEIHRVLRGGAPLLVSFHVGDEVRHVDEMLGRRVSLDFRLLRSDSVVAMLEATGFAVETSMERDAYTAVEAPTRRGYVVARRS